MTVLVVAATERELAFLPRDVPRLVCGVGPVEAAATTTFTIDHRRPHAVLQIGIAGARRGGPAAVGDVVIGTRARYADLRATIRVVTSVTPSPALLAAARAALPEAHALEIATTGSVGGAGDADVEAMEGFAVLRACELADVPALELRAISNLVDDPRESWNIKIALMGVEEATLRLLDALSRDAGPWSARPGA